MRQFILALLLTLSLPTGVFAGELEDALAKLEGASGEEGIEALEVLTALSFELGTERMGAALPRLAELAQGEDRAVASRAAWLLGSLGEAGLQASRELLRSGGGAWSSKAEMSAAPAAAQELVLSVTAGWFQQRVPAPALAEPLLSERWVDQYAALVAVSRRLQVGDAKLAALREAMTTLSQREGELPAAAGQLLRSVPARATAPLDAYEGDEAAQLAAIKAGLAAAEAEARHDALSRLHDFGFAYGARAAAGLLEAVAPLHEDESGDIRLRAAFVEASLGAKGQAASRARLELWLPEVDGDEAFKLADPKAKQQVGQVIAGWSSRRVPAAALQRTLSQPTWLERAAALLAIIRRAREADSSVLALRGPLQTQLASPDAALAELARQALRELDAAFPKDR